MKEKESTRTTAKDALDGGSRGVERALGILLEVARSAKPLSFVELQKKVELPKATLHKLLLTLEKFQFLARDEGSGRYTVGLSALEVASGGSFSTDIRTITYPILQRLSEEWEETVHLGVLDAGEIVYLARVDPSEQMVRLADIVGRRIPAYASAGGTAALAALYDEAILTLFPSVLPSPPTRNSVRTREELQHRLADAREKGYGIDLEETFMGVRGVGVAVASAGWPIIALSFSIPLQRAPIERLRELARPLKLAAKEIDTTLALRPRPY